MIKFLTEGDMAVVRTEKQFVVIIKNEIHGPFKNEYADIIIKLIEKGGQVDES